MAQATQDQRVVAEATAGRVVTKLDEFYNTLSTEEQNVLDVSLSSLVPEDEAADVSGYAAKRAIVSAVAHAILWYFDNATPIWEIYEPGDYVGSDPSVSHTGGCCVRHY